MISLHRLLLAALLVGNAVAFAGVDPPTRLISAVIVLVLMIDLRALPEVPKAARWAAWAFVALVAVQLLPLPEALRSLLQPGFSEVMADGWGTLSLAPWATVRVAASAAVVAGIALTAARMAATRSGLPLLLGLVAATCGVVAVLGLAGESGAPERVLLVRANTGGGDVYGPFVNSNHFATAVELGLPAALVLLAAALRNISRPGAARQRAAVTALASAVLVTVAVAALLRSSSRGGVLFLAAALVVTATLWLRHRSSRLWPWLAGAAILLAGAVALAWPRLPELRDGFAELLAVEGVEGNTRWDLWAGTIESFKRSPLVGSGLGSYRFVIGLDKPATGAAVLEQAHNDWLEWASTGGVAGCAVLALLLVAIWSAVRPRWARRLRFDLRYPLAGAAVAMVATGLHETVGFGLQTPLTAYLLAVWVGLVWGVWARVERGSEHHRAVGRTNADGNDRLLPDLEGPDADSEAGSGAGDWDAGANGDE